MQPCDVYLQITLYHLTYILNKDTSDTLAYCTCVHPCVQYTALMFATMSGSIPTVNVLLEHGAKPHATNKHGRTAAQVGAFIGKVHYCNACV